MGYADLRRHVNQAIAEKVTKKQVKNWASLHDFGCVFAYRYPYIMNLTPSKHCQILNVIIHEKFNSACSIK